MNLIDDIWLFTWWTIGIVGWYWLYVKILWFVDELKPEDADGFEQTLGVVGSGICVAILPFIMGVALVLSPLILLFLMSRWLYHNFLVRGRTR